MRFKDWLSTLDEKFKSSLQNLFILFGCTDMIRKSTDKRSKRNLLTVVREYGQRIANENVDNERLGDWINRQIENNPVLITLISSYYTARFCKEIIEKYGDEQLKELKNVLTDYLDRLEKIEVPE